MRWSVQAANSWEVKLLEAMKYGGSLLHLIDCSEEGGKISNICIIFAQSQGGYEHESPVSGFICVFFFFFHGFF